MPAPPLDVKATSPHQRKFYAGFLLASVFFPILVWNASFSGWAADAFFALLGGGAIWRYGVPAILVCCLAAGIVGLVREWGGIRPRVLRLVSIVPLLFLFLVIWTTFFSALDRKQNVPADAWQALRNPGHVVLYSIDPRMEFPHDESGKPIPAAGERFHDYIVLGSAALDGAQAAKAATAFRRALTWPFGMRANCFDPRHALRVESGGHAYDILLCYECGGIVVFRDNAQIFYGSTGGSARVLNSLLRDANVPLPKD